MVQLNAKASEYKTCVSIRNRLWHLLRDEGSHFCSQDCPGDGDYLSQPHARYFPLHLTSSIVRRRPARRGKQREETNCDTVGSKDHRCGRASKSHFGTNS